MSPPFTEMVLVPALEVSVKVSEPPTAFANAAPSPVIAALPALELFRNSPAIGKESQVTSRVRGYLIWALLPVLGLWGRLHFRSLYLRPRTHTKEPNGF